MKRSACVAPARFRLPLGVLAPLLAGGGALVLCTVSGAVARAHPALAERVFARGLYALVSNGLARVTGLLPFSLLEFGLIALTLLALVLALRLVRKLVRSPGRRAELGMLAFARMFCVFGAGMLVFTLLCGVNYARVPFSAYSGLEIKPSSQAELDQLCTTLAGQANALRAGLAEDAQGVALFFGDGYAPTADETRAAMQALAEEYDVLAGYYPKPKAIFFSPVMSRADLTGVYSPFTMEANVNVACPGYTIPATMCHELSHLRGFMREDEANFIAYLACMASPSKELRYSGTMLALVHAGNQLYALDPARYGLLRGSYSDGVSRDLNANSSYWRQFEDSKLTHFSTKVNDTYLKANRQTDGVRSYGRMVDLLLALQRAGGI